MRRALDTLCVPEPYPSLRSIRHESRDSCVKETAPDYGLSRGFTPLDSDLLARILDYRDLLILLVRRDFLSKYSNVLGPAWFIVQPLLTTLMFFFIFRRVAQI